VFTDKLVAKIPSTHDGVIKKINFKTDEICLVGKPLIELELGDDVKAAATPDTASAQASQPKEAKVD
jgi:pyruvate/2-oxoglutarate dehydrogenase complex dihydrolipoamide acyltransferase (E2) component